MNYDDLIWTKTILALAIEHMAIRIEKEKGTTPEVCALRDARNMATTITIPEKPRTWSISDTFTAQRAIEKMMNEI
jgi:hypothetical protein